MVLIYHVFMASRQSGFGMIIILDADGFVFVGWIFYSLVSVAFPRFWECVVAVDCLVGSASESLPGVTSGVPNQNLFLCVGNGQE